MGLFVGFLFVTRVYSTKSDPYSRPRMPGFVSHFFIQEKIDYYGNGGRRQENEEKMKGKVAGPEFPKILHIRLFVGR